MVTMSNDPTSNDARYIEAKRHVEALRGFYIHAIVYGCVISPLVGLNMVLRGGWWVQWPLLGWGAGLLVHGLTVFTPFELFGPDWQARRIAKRLDRIR
jgi:hypothetical protein